MRVARLFLAFHNICFLLAHEMRPCDFRELGIEVFLDFLKIRMRNPPNPLDQGGVTHLTSESEIIHLIPRDDLDSAIETRLLITFLRTESEMFLVCTRCCDDTSIAGGVATIFAVIGFCSCIEAFCDRRMCIFVTNICRDTTIESIEISDPITVIIFVHIFHDPSFEGIELIHPCLIHDHGSFLTTNSSCTVEYYFLSSEFILIFLEEFRNFTEIIGSCRNRSSEVPESIFIIISHIENRVFIMAIIDHLLEFSYGYFFMILCHFGFCHLLPKSHDLMTYLHTHTGKLVIIDGCCFRLYISNILEIFGCFEKFSIAPALPIIPRHSRTDPFCSDVDSSLQSYIASEVEVFLSKDIELRFWNINEFIKREEAIFRLVPSIELRDHISCC